MGLRELTLLDDSLRYSLVPEINRFHKYPERGGVNVPIIALTFHDVRVKLRTRTIQECVAVIYKTSASGDKWLLSDQAPQNANTGTALVNADLKVRLMITSVYLDSTERNAMTSVTHSFLINVAQKQAHSVSAGMTTKQEAKLYHNHPATSLIWYCRPLDWATAGGRRRYSCGYKDRYDLSSQIAIGEVDSSTGVRAIGTEDLPFGDCVSPIATASLSLNGHQRWPNDMPTQYFRYHIPYTSWRTMPTTDIYSYSFALEAASWQPTSHLNFSRLDHVSLGLTFNQGIKASELVTMVEAYNLN